MTFPGPWAGARCRAGCWGSGTTNTPSSSLEEHLPGQGRLCRGALLPQGESRGSGSHLHRLGALGHGVRGGAPGVAGGPGAGARVSEGWRQGLGARGSAGAAARLAVVPVAAEAHLDGQATVGAWLVLAAVIWEGTRWRGRRGWIGHQSRPTTGENSTGQDSHPHPTTSSQLHELGPVGGGPRQQSTGGPRGPSLPISRCRGNRPPTPLRALEC